MDDADTDKATSQHRSSVATPLIWGLLLLVAYPLSLGPAAGIHHRVSNPAVRSAIEAVYYPLEVATRATPIEDLLMVYMDLFR